MDTFNLSEKYLFRYLLVYFILIIMVPHINTFVTENQFHYQKYIISFINTIFIFVLVAFLYKIEVKPVFNWLVVSIISSTIFQLAFIVNNISVNLIDYIFVLSNVLLLFIFTSVLDLRKFKFIWELLFFNIISQILFAFVYFLIGNPKTVFKGSLVGTFHNPNQFQMYLTFLCCGLFLTKKNYTVNCIIFLIIGVIAIFNELRLQSFIFLLPIAYYLKAKKNVSLYVLIPIFISSLFFLLYLKRDSTLGHLLILKVCGLSLNDSLPFGYGLNRFSSTYMLNQHNYFKSYIFSERELYLADNNFVAHSDLLTYIIEFGIFSIPTLIIIYVLLIDIYRKYNYDWAVQSIILCLLVCFLFSYPSQVTVLVPIIIIVLSLIFSDSLSAKKVLFVENKVKNILFLTLFSLLVFLGFNLYELLRWGNNYKDFKDSKVYLLDWNIGYLRNKADYFRSKNNYFESTNYLKKINEIFLTYDNLILIGKNFYDDKQYDSSRVYFKKANFMIPHRILPKYYIMKSYLRQNDKENIVLWANIVRNSKVKFQTKTSKNAFEESELILNIYDK